MSWKEILFPIWGALLFLLRFLLMTIGVIVIAAVMGIDISNEDIPVLLCAFGSFYVARYIDPERILGSERKKRELEAESERRRLDIKIAIAEMRLEETKRKIERLERESGK